jgi:hypothetical protein
VAQQIPQTFHAVDPWLQAVRQALARGHCLVTLWMGRSPKMDQDLVGFYSLSSGGIQYWTIPLADVGAHMIRSGLGGGQQARQAVNQYLTVLPELLSRAPTPEYKVSRWSTIKSL